MSNLKDLFCNIKWLIRQSFGKRLGHYYQYSVNSYVID